MLAADNGHVSVMRRLLRHGADLWAVNEDGQTCLSRAGNNGHLEACVVIMESLPSKEDKTRMVQIQDATGTSATTWATQEDHVPVAEFLLQFYDRSALEREEDKEGFNMGHWATM